MTSADIGYLESWKRPWTSWYFCKDAFIVWSTYLLFWSHIELQYSKLQQLQLKLIYPVNIICLNMNRNMFESSGSVVEVIWSCNMLYLLILNAFIPSIYAMIWRLHPELLLCWLETSSCMWSILHLWIQTCWRNSIDESIYLFLFVCSLLQSSRGAPWAKPRFAPWIVILPNKLTTSRPQG